MSILLTPLEEVVARAAPPEEIQNPWEAAFAKSVLTPEEIGKLDLPKRSPILGSWFREGDLGFIYGPRGLGKTWLAMLIARSLAEGKPVGPWTTPAARRVLYVDGEMAVDASLERIEQMVPIESDNFRLLHHEVLFHQTGTVLNLTSPQTQAALTKTCLDRKVEVLVLDNISCLFTLKENEADAWGAMVLPWLLELRRHHIAVIFVHHAGRNGNMRGTSKREDAAFWIIKLSESKADADDNGAGATFIASFDKHRNGTADDAPTLLWRFLPQRDGSVIPVYEKLSAMEVFLGLVRDGLCSCTDIAEEMSYSKGAVSKLAKKAEKAGHIVIDGRSYVLRKG